MRVLMLGWEFPPWITGGLGTACHGLTRALSRLGVEVLFVMPRMDGPGVWVSDAGKSGRPGLAGVTFRHVPSQIASPYPGAAGGVSSIAHELEARRSAALRIRGECAEGPPVIEGDHVAQCERYARACEQAVAGEAFDIIHAHDWMTWPAALRIARATGRPLIAHVHSTEYDRAGEDGSPAIYAIERSGLRGADQVVCVSHLTARLCAERYGVPESVLEVVYNGVDQQEATAPVQRSVSAERFVLFLGRVTRQKGPEYFVAAARRVLGRVGGVRFVVAGSGDMMEQTRRMARDMGVDHRFVFTGFLRGEGVGRALALADVLVMPSISEPFGIAPLEAIRRGVPVIVSTTSGIAEAVGHLLKVDYWDVEGMADRILAILSHPPLREALKRNAAIETEKLNWDTAAKKCIDVYGLVLRR